MVESVQMMLMDILVVVLLVITGIDCETSECVVNILYFRFYTGGKFEILLIDDKCTCYCATGFRGVDCNLNCVLNWHCVFF